MHDVYVIFKLRINVSIQMDHYNKHDFFYKYNTVVFKNMTITAAF